MYEYKFLPAPRQVDRDGHLRNDAEGLTGSLDGEATLLSAAGWEYLRCDTVPVKARRFVFFTATRAQPVVVYRRPMRDPAPAPERPAAPAPEPSAAVRPRRVIRSGLGASRTPLLLLGPVRTGPAE
jgi:hypothetical protein